MKGSILNVGDTGSLGEPRENIGVRRTREKQMLQIQQSFTLLNSIRLQSWGQLLEAWLALTIG